MSLSEAKLGASGGDLIVVGYSVLAPPAPGSEEELAEVRRTAWKDHGLSDAWAPSVLQRASVHEIDLGDGRVVPVLPPVLTDWADLDMDLISFGPVFLEVVFGRFDQLPLPGEEIFIDPFTFSLGGAITIATTACQGGVSAGLATVLGDDLGSRLAEEHSRRPFSLATG